MSQLTFLAPDAETTVIHLVTPETWATFAAGAAARLIAVAAREGFSGKAGQMVEVTGENGGLEQVFFGLGDSRGLGAMAIRGLAARLPTGNFRFAPEHPGLDPAQAALAWGLGVYRFDRYRTDRPASAARLAAPAGADLAWVQTLIRSCAMARDMINTPANDMGPHQIETIARELAKAHGAAIAVTTGDDLIEAGYPLVHAVGRAAAVGRAPRMIELTWGDKGRPLIAVIGKGVTFDTGGLDIKPSAGMRWMKKDMGGAAHALALARMVLETRLPVRLSLLIPAVENAIAGEAIRPGDVFTSRKGPSIEIGNTDAEGRLILADALARAEELVPDLTIDLATLTGAARVALGPEVVPFYTDDEALAAELIGAGRAVDDPIWRMPLWTDYDSALESEIADIKNDADAWAQAGSVTAALFLKRFAPKGAWVHFDIFAWNARNRPGFPQGAEAQAIRAIFAVLQARYG